MLLLSGWLLLVGIRGLVTGAYEAVNIFDLVRI